MSDSYKNQSTNGREFPNERNGARNGLRGGRAPGNREGGGFRIRLSDNEMRAARLIQETFNLRSTVAVLGFALRTLAQMIEEGKLDDVLSQYKFQNTSSNKTDTSVRKNRFDNDIKAQADRGSKPNPFARPAKPQPTNQTEKDNESIEQSTNTESETHNQVKEQPSSNADETSVPTTES